MDIPGTIILPTTGGSFGLCRKLSSFLGRALGPREGASEEMAEAVTSSRESGPGVSGAAFPAQGGLERKTMMSLAMMSTSQGSVMVVVPGWRGTVGSGRAPPPVLAPDSRMLTPHVKCILSPKTQAGSGWDPRAVGPRKSGPQWTQAQPCPHAPAMTLTSVPDRSLRKAGRGGGEEGKGAVCGCSSWHHTSPSYKRTNGL